MLKIMTRVPPLVAAMVLLCCPSEAFTPVIFHQYPSLLQSPPKVTTSTLYASTLEKTSETQITTTPSEKKLETSNDDIPLAPLTQWGEPYDDIVAIQQEAKRQTLPKFSYEIDAMKVLPSASTSSTVSREEIEIQYLEEHRLDIVNKMQDHGCVIFRNFTLMTTPNGFTTFYQTLQMHPCCDPLHTVSARPTIATTSTTNNNNNKKSPIYEAVNKESRKNFFIGMHQEFVGTRAPAGAAFCCFTAAPVGGEFLIADARRIFQNLPTDLLQALYQQQIRYSVIELPFFSFIDTAVIEPLREPVANVIQNVIQWAMNQKVDFDIDLQWITNQESIYQNHNDVTPSSSSSSTRILQARAPKQPPIIPHPITKDPVWFCNVHSHSAVLRQQRESMYVLFVCLISAWLAVFVDSWFSLLTKSDVRLFHLFRHLNSYGAERFEDGASQINKSDMYFGNNEPLTVEQLKILDDVTTAQMKYVKMNPGDVVLLDNYKTLHGRNVFDGVRKHGVAWFEGWERS